MTPEELSRIRNIYEQALPMAGSARETFLRQECQGADELRAEIERLLSAHENIPSWLEQPVWGSAGTVCRSRSSENRGPPSRRLHPDPRDRPGRYGLGLSRRAIRRNVPPAAPPSN